MTEDALLDLIAEMLDLACARQDGSIDTAGVPVYTDAVAVLADCGRLDIVQRRLPKRLIARWVDGCKPATRWPGMKHA